MKSYIEVRRARRRERGAAMLEGVIVVLFLVAVGAVIWRYLL